MPSLGVNYARRSALYILALWGRHLPVQTTEADEIPRLQDEVISLPASWKQDTDSGLLFRAAACHAAAHSIYGGEVAYEVGDLRPRQLALIGLIEDARVEALAMREYPGLRKLWYSFHTRGLPDTLSFPVLVRRLAAALLNTSRMDTNLWVRKGVQLFYQQDALWQDPEFAMDLGLRLASDLGQMRIAMDDGKPFQVFPYRDDNRHLWREIESQVSDESNEGLEADTTLDGAFLREADEGRVLELADVEGIDQLPGLRRVQEAESESDAVLEYRRADQPPPEQRLTYPEWNYQLELERKNWSTVQERPVSKGAYGWVRSILKEQHPTLVQMQRVAHSIHLEKVQRARRQLDGDELDLSAALEAIADLRNGQEPDLRIHYRVRPLHDRGLASLILLDLSESGNDQVPGSGQTVIELTRQASLLLGHALQALGERFAIHGFASRGRHDVGYYRVKDFSDDFDDDAMTRIAGMQGNYSTRLGTALRHALTDLMAQEEQRKLLLVVTDGSPSDIDVYDPEYLSQDARHAVHESLRAGVQVFCLCLDAGAQAKMLQIFGQRRYRILDHVERLPRLLPEVLLSLVRRY